MRLTILRDFPRIIIYLGLLALLLLALATFGSAANKKTIPTKNEPFGSKIQDEEVSRVNPPQPRITPDDNDSNNETKSSSTKVHVSVSTSTTNGETDRSANVEITTNGQTLDFTDALDKCINGGKARIRDDGSRLECEINDSGLHIEWKSVNKQSQKNEIEAGNDVDQSKSSR